MGQLEERSSHKSFLYFDNTASKLCSLFSSKEKFATSFKIESSSEEGGVVVVKGTTFKSHRSFNPGDFQLILLCTRASYFVLSLRWW